MLKFILSLFFTFAIASEDDAVYYEHIRSSYKNPTEFKAESEKCIQLAKSMIEQGSSIRKIMDTLAEKRKIIEKGNPDFGLVRKGMLLTAGNNYFIMRDEVEKILKRLFESDSLLLSSEIESKAAQIKDPTFSVSVRYARHVFHQLEKIKIENSETENADFDYTFESECSRFLIDIGLITKDEMRTSLYTTNRFKKIYESYLYASCMSLKAIIARYKGIHLEHKGYCQTDQLAQILPYFYFLKRRLKIQILRSI
ncbi:MAG: hypothetical protein NEHIOOID_00345 [Holosporales bacterium]